MTRRQTKEAADKRNEMTNGAFNYRGDYFAQFVSGSWTLRFYNNCFERNEIKLAGLSSDCCVMSSSDYREGPAISVQSAHNLMSKDN